MPERDFYALYPLGFLHSPLKQPGEAPRQGREGAPDAWLEVNASVAEGLEGIAVGAEIFVITETGQKAPCFQAGDEWPLLPC